MNTLDKVFLDKFNIDELEDYIQRRASQLPARIPIDADGLFDLLDNIHIRLQDMHPCIASAPERSFISEAVFMSICTKMYGPDFKKWWGDGV